MGNFGRKALRGPSEPPASLPLPPPPPPAAPALSDLITGQRQMIRDRDTEIARLKREHIHLRGMLTSAGDEVARLRQAHAMVRDFAFELTEWRRSYRGPSMMGAQLEKFPPAQLLSRARGNSEAYRTMAVIAGYLHR